MMNEAIIREIKKQSLPVIICGAGVVGKALFDLCAQAGITVACFCDRSEKVAGTKFCGLEVLYTPELKTKYQNAIFIISVAAIKDVVDLLQTLGFSHWYAGGLLLQDVDVTQDQPDAALDYAKYAIETCILCHNGYVHPDQLFLRSIDIIITERCSLKCQGCSNLMQYYQQPKNCDRELLNTSIDAFCQVIDEVMDFRVLGGEPFMNPEWPLIVKKLVNIPKAKRVVLFTNGTIVPNEQSLSVLKNDKVRVIISDYGKVSRKLAELKLALEQNKIAHHALAITEWLDCSDISPHHRTNAQQRELFKRCCAKNMATLSDGKLFRCPYSANAARLSAVPDFKNDYVDLLREPLDAENILATKHKIRDFLLNKEYLETCDFCKGRPLAGPEIPPAQQASQPLPYHKYAG